MKIKCSICNHEQDIRNELLFLGVSCERCNFTFYPEQIEVQYQIEENDHFLVSKSLNSLSYPVHDKSGFAKYLVKFDKLGRIVERSTYDIRNYLKCNEDGIALYKYTYNRDGHLKAIRFYNEFKQITGNKEHIYKLMFHFDHKDRLIKKEYKTKASITKNIRCFEYNADDKVVLIRTFDDKKRIISEIYFDYCDNGYTVNVFGDNNGRLYKKAERRYDSNSNILRKEFFQPVNTSNLKYNKSSYIVYDYDVYGNMSKESYYSHKHVLTEVVDYHYNIDQKIVSMDEFKLCKDNDKVMKKTYSAVYLYNDHGILLSKKVLKDSYDNVISIYKYDTQGLLIEKRYYDHNLKLINHRLQEFAIVKYQYDQWGNITVEKRYDKECCIINLYCNIAYSESTYNEFREVIMIKYFDNNNQRCSDDNNIATIRYEYDEKGRLCIEMYYDLSNQLVNNHQGIAFCKYEYENNKQFKHSFNKDFKQINQKF